MYILISLCIIFLIYIFSKKNPKSADELIDENFSVWLKIYNNSTKNEKNMMAIPFISMVIRAGEKFHLISSTDAQDIRNQIFSNESPIDLSDVIDQWFERTFENVKQITGSEYFLKSPAWLIGTLIFAGVVHVVPDRGIRDLLEKIT